jgi:hypothetical protein
MRSMVPWGNSASPGEAFVLSFRFTEYDFLERGICETKLNSLFLQH